MKYLLDTHACFWSIFEKEKLSSATRSILEDIEAEIMVSQVSLWEIAIKYRLGKFSEFNATLEEFIEAVIKAGFSILTLKNEHLTAYFNYPHFTDDHKDPFDRLLLVTADVERASLITKDEKFSVYKERLNIVW
ncbi:MAG: type II toxin-antitoxin system VapC family toxin [Chitinophagaceae bacterium]|nr:MAG: type II toxin-antitoxin system VapC family toxin [Chitinophagaceae bacterium]